VNVPINCFWQDWLEATFPGSKPAPAAAPSEKKTKAQKKQLDVRNTLIKFACDQTIGAAFNVPLFLATIGAVKGQGLEQIVNTIQKVSCHDTRTREGR
jgi:protein Mpv17